MKSSAPRRTRPKARQTREQLDQPLDLRTGDTLSHANEVDQNGSFMPGGSGRPAVTSRIFSSVTTLGLLAGILVRRDDEILQDLLLLGLEQARIDDDALHRSLGAERDGDEAAAGLPLDFDLFERGLRIGHLGLHRLRLLHDAHEVFHAESFRRIH